MTDVYASATNTDIITGADLNLTTTERAAAAGRGSASFVLMIVGGRVAKAGNTYGAKFKGKTINCFAAGTLVKMDDTIAAKDESTASDWAIAAASVPIALIGYSLSRRRRRKRDEHADVDDYFSEFRGQFVTDHDAITALMPRLETRR